MKKLILSTILVVFIFLLSPRVAYAGTDAECRPVFDQDMKKCTVNFNACIHLCGEETKKPNGDTYFNSGEIYSKCTKREQCTEKSSDCNAKALEDFWACRKSDKKPKEAKKETSSGPGFIKINPIETWRKIYNFLDDLIQLDAMTRNGQGMIGTTHLTEASGSDIPNPVLSQELDESGNPYDFLPGYTPHSIIEWGSSYTYKEKTRLNDKKKNHFFEVRPGKSGQAILKTPADEKGGYILEEGEVEIVKASDYSESGTFGIKSPNGFFTVSHTHFLVSYDKDKNQTTLVVYDGEVSVKTNDGQTTTVSPKDGKPGAIVIAQKLSPVKLALVGLVAIGIIGGVVWFFKRKTSKKKSR